MITTVIQSHIQKKKEDMRINGQLRFMILNTLASFVYVLCLRSVYVKCYTSSRYPLDGRANADGQIRERTWWWEQVKLTQREFS
jgi:hypothetical protein